ncbi:MAG: peptide ABC transporter substrate-binding protein [Alphaproteobacteria bacterium]|nr:peptide ABC transporter substrate-binding protein [Alphaproteobacteria bacterium]
MQLLFVFCALILAFFGSLPAKAGSHAQLRIGMSQFPSSLHPSFDDMTAKSYVLGMSQRPVTAHDANWQPICILCTELPTYANGRAKKETLKDGRHGIAATYTIQPKATWGDGVPVTTKDILFGWEVGKHPQSGVGNSDFFARDIASVTAIDDKNFTIHFSKEQCEFASISDFFALPEHLERKIFEQDPATYKNRTLYNTAPANPGLYWGPYKVVKVDSGASITLDKNPTWYGAQPAFDTITVKIIENSAALAANLLSGDIDYIAGELGLALDQAIAFEKRLKPGAYQVVYKPGLIYEHIDLDLDQLPFNDLRLRQALMYGMNREKINRTLFDGKQPVAATDVNPLDTVYNKDVKQYAYDPDAAAKLLDDAGWKTAPDGVRANAKGEKLSFTLSTTAGNKTREVIEQALQSDWKKLGIDVKIENQPARVLFGDTIRERKFKGGVMFAWTSAPKNIPKTSLHSSMIPTAANNYAGQNYSGYINKNIDKIIDDLEVVCAPKANQALWDSLQKIYADDLPALPLYYRAEAYFIPQWLKGIIPTGHMQPTTLWIENWSAAE